MKKNLEIISLIYKSVPYLDLITTELKKDYCRVPDWDIGIRVIANNATPEVLDHLKYCDIPYSVYVDKNPLDYYMNRVYRCFNYAGQMSAYDNVCFINSDMVFSNEWLSNLLKHHNGINIPCSRLVESGKLLSGQYAIGNKNFGKSVKEIDYSNWYRYADELKLSTFYSGGLFMPCVFEKERFLESGMYPEGNIYQDGRAGSLKGGVVLSGDAWYFQQLQTNYAMKHITVFDSLVYHIQEGEKDE